MPLDGFNLEPGSTAGATAPVQAEVLRQLQGTLDGTLKLEDKVTQLFEQLRGPVYQYLVAVFGGPAEAEDITQDAFLQLHLALHKGQSIGDVRGWIFRVAHNRAINVRKHQQFLGPVDTGRVREMRELLADPALSPEQRVLEAEKYERLESGLGRLSPQERQCLYLRAEGFRYREIAAILGISTSSVVEFLGRAIKKLAPQNNG